MHFHKGDGEMPEYIVVDGELVEKPDTNQLMIRELREVGVDLAEYDELEAQAEYIKEQLDLWVFKHREAIKQTMMANGEKTIRTQNRTYSIIPAGITKRLDTERVKKYLEEKGLLDDYMLYTEKDEQLRITKRR